VLTTRPEQPGDPSGRGKALTRGLEYMVLGTEVALTVAAASLLGWWLDSEFGTAPWLLLVLVLLGTGAAMVRLVRLGRKLERLEEREARSDGDDAEGD